MSPTDRYMPGVPCWADTTQPDPEAAAEFYGELFGWDFEDVMPPGSDAKYLEARIRGERVAAISSGGPEAPETAAWNMYVWTDSADDAAARVREAGGAVTTEPMDVMDAGRMATFTDAEGAAFGVWEPGEHRGAAVVNEHGAVNFNDLNTRDLGAAKSFYATVFGWEAATMDGGFEMWALAGYGDLLERINPGTRERMRELGAPEGFEDAVASVVPLGDDRPDVPAHWGITFGVDDADRAAERAEALGGKVVSPPMDLPWVRMTVITDPQGATFTASKFVPPA